MMTLAYDNVLRIAYDSTRGARVTIPKIFRLYGMSQKLCIACVMTL